MKSLRFIKTIFCTAILIPGTAISSSPNAGFLGLKGIFGSHNLALVEPLFGNNDDHCFDRPDRFIALLNPPTNDDKDGIYNSKRAKKCNAIAAQFRTWLGTPQTSAPSFSGRSIPIFYDDAHRNEVIDSMIATSNQKCATYSAYIKNVDGAVNSSLSLAAIISGGIGPIAGGEATAKALSATSAIFSGARAAVNETYLTNQTIHVLVAAFEKVRLKILEEIEARKTCPHATYTVTQGIGDALRYHNSCSLVVGLGETAKAVERADNPGIKEMADMLTQLAALKMPGTNGATQIAAANGATASSATKPATDKTVDASATQVSAAGAANGGTTPPQAVAPTAFVALLTKRAADGDTLLKAKQAAFDKADKERKDALAAYQKGRSGKTAATLALTLAAAVDKTDKASAELAQATTDQTDLKLLLNAANQVQATPPQTKCPLPSA